MNTKLTISSRRATTAFDRFNATITDVYDFSSANQTNFTAAEFLTFFDIVFDINQNDTNWFKSTQYLFMVGIASYLETPSNTQNGTGADDRLSRLREFLATPVFAFNMGVYNSSAPEPDMGTQAALATPSYRVLIHPHFR